MRILSLDPGKVDSFAFALIDSGVCLKTGILWSMEDLTPDLFEKNYTKFAKQVRQLIKDCELKPERDRIVLERYITRPGMGMGNNSEFINIMIGIITMIAAPIPVVAIPSSQWKNYMRRKYSIGKAVKIDKKKNPNKKETLPCKYENILDFLGQKYPASTKAGVKKDWLVVHEADALGIGIYWWEELTGKDILETVWDGMDNGKSKHTN